MSSLRRATLRLIGFVVIVVVASRVMLSLIGSVSGSFIDRQDDFLASPVNVTSEAARAEICGIGVCAGGLLRVVGELLARRDVLTYRCGTSGAHEPESAQRDRGGQSVLAEDRSATTSICPASGRYGSAR
jgi:hypothetical protein